MLIRKSNTNGRVTMKRFYWLKKIFPNLDVLLNSEKAFTGALTV